MKNRGSKKLLLPMENKRKSKIFAPPLPAKSKKESRIIKPARIKTRPQR